MSDPLPLVTTVQHEPHDVCHRLAHRPGVVFLDSGMQVGQYGRYSYVASDPYLIIQSKGDSLQCMTADRTEQSAGDPFELLKRHLAAERDEPVAKPVPFTGGAIGYLGYDLCHFIERLPRTAVDDIGAPDMCFGFYDVVYAWDHDLRRGYLISSGHDADRRRPDPGRARQRLREFEEMLAAPAPPPLDPNQPAGVGEPVSNFTRPQYLKALERTIEYIHAGDIFQANLSQRFQADLAVSPWHLYTRLRHVNPAPFAAYLDFGQVQIVSSSPEQFLQVEADHVTTRPIKGTRPRGRTPEQDEKLARELLESDKDRAELTMIVDLERNDLGHVCRFGTVKVPELFVLESYPTVHHLVSTVEGRLQPGCDVVDLLRASFPGGSITGAPKVRAMEIIDELEPTQRSAYTGSIGYLGRDGTTQLSIVIRTFIVSGTTACYYVGGGIVADSQPEAEYQETLDKGKALRQALTGSGQ
jgi:para-aminobenzoate synthetase component I